MELLIDKQSKVLKFSSGVNQRWYEAACMWEVYAGKIKKSSLHSKAFSEALLLV